MMGLVIMECANRELKQLGFTDVASADLLGQCAEENHGTSSIHSHAVLLFMDESHRIRSRARQDKRQSSTRTCFLLFYHSARDPRRPSRLQLAFSTI